MTKCVLCDNEAVTTAAMICVCEEHYREYAAEASAYLYLNERPFYERLQAAERRRRHSNSPSVTINAQVRMNA